MEHVRRISRGAAGALMFVLALMLSGGVTLLAMPMTSAAAPLTMTSHTQRAASANHVTVIILDMSGSMAQNDPNGLRCSAANAYIDLSGPGDFVGVVGLDSNGASGGPHNFGSTVDWGLTPRELATVNARQGLRAAIQQKSNGCRPDGDTPTYDALAKAEAMLASATQNGAISGSVILLTDGTPYPDTNAQISAIQQELAPQFKAHNWPIDTIALGSDQSFHPFLSGLASATSGNFYDDGNGVVPGVSPLNITPFFVKIFSERIGGRTLGPTIPVTNLDGGTTSRDFQLGPGNNDLYVIVVKDRSSTTVTTTSPDGQTLPPQVPGTQVLTGDPYYAMFIVNGPQDGTWQVN